MKRPIKPKPSSPVKATIADLYNRLQRPDTRRLAVAELLTRFRASDEHMLMCKIMRKTSTEIKTYQHNSERPEFVFQINMQHEDRSKPHINGHYYPPVYVIKSWNDMIDGVILSYLEICKQRGRFV